MDVNTIFNRPRSRRPRNRLLCNSINQSIAVTTLDDIPPPGRKEGDDNLGDPGQQRNQGSHGASVVDAATAGIRGIGDVPGYMLLPIRRDGYEQIDPLILSQDDRRPVDAFDLQRGYEHFFPSIPSCSAGAPLRHCCPSLPPPSLLALGCSHRPYPAFRRTKCVNHASTFSESELQRFLCLFHPIKSIFRLLASGIGRGGSQALSEIGSLLFHPYQFSSSGSVSQGSQRGVAGGAPIIFRILRLHPVQQIEAFCTAGTDHYRRSNPETGKPGMYTGRTGRCGQ